MNRGGYRSAGLIRAYPLMPFSIINSVESVNKITQQINRPVILGIIINHRGNFFFQSDGQ